MDVAIILVIAAALWQVEYRLAPRFNSQWCGLGALKMRSDTQKSPMAYRVLALPFVRFYQPFKFACIALALGAVRYAAGWEVMLITAALLPVTFWYDVWDWGIELAGVWLAISGNLPAALILAVLWGLSRETAFMGGIAYWLATGDYLGGVAVTFAGSMSLITVRRWTGLRPMYCDRFMVAVNNGLLMNGNVKAWTSVALIVLACAGAVVRGRVDGLVPLVLIVAGVTMGKLDETRLFASALPLIGGLWHA